MATWPHLTILVNCDGVEAFNLGTGNGVSVLELVSAFEEASGQKIPYQIVDRRAGDVATSFADASRASDLMNWSPKEACGDVRRCVELGEPQKLS